jgi:hypothetical protein
VHIFFLSAYMHIKHTLAHNYIMRTVVRTLPMSLGSDDSSKSQHSIVKTSSYGCLLGHRFSSSIVTSSQTGLSVLKTTSVRYIATSIAALFASSDNSSQQFRASFPRCTLFGSCTNPFSANIPLMGKQSLPVTSISDPPRGVGFLHVCVCRCTDSSMQREFIV